jgi:hypothetical protein
MEGKQAEFLVERQFPWDLVERIGGYGPAVVQRAFAPMEAAAHRPRVEIRREGYY